MEEKKRIYKALLGIAEEQGITRYALAGKLDMTVRGVYTWDEEWKAPPYERLEEIAGILDVKLKILIEEK